MVILFVSLYWFLWWIKREQGLCLNMLSVFLDYLRMLNCCSESLAFWIWENILLCWEGIWFVPLFKNELANLMQCQLKRMHSPPFSSVQSLSRVRLFVTPWIAACQASLSITNSQSSLRFMSIESAMPSGHLILCRPLLLLPPIPPSIRVFSNESTLCMRWPKYWSFSFSIIPSKEIPGLIFRMDWLDLLAVQGTLKSLLQ